MSDREQFLVWVQSEFVRAERAMYDGDDGPRRAVWSEHEPVSVLGAWRNATDRAELVEAFDLARGVHDEHRESAILASLTVATP
ncbi:hypothetical protein [Agromyces allii]|uniref:DUF4937 domain-containing protein n=1 Tax=Agromyces allii TaxID=393607 RepID=A0ABN2QZH1_9MICO|nr:hypothetical protein [Agromyces allii]